MRTPCVFVGNNYYDLAAFGRRNDLCSGELCVYVVKEQTLLGLALLPLKVALGLSHPANDVEFFRVRSVTTHSSRRRLRVSRDGETSREPTPLVYRILPNALLVLTPQKTDSQAPFAA